MEGSQLLGASHLLCSPSLVTHVRDSDTWLQEKDTGKCRKQRRASSGLPV